MPSELMGGMVGMLLVSLLSTSAFVGVVIYVVARWRTYREAAPADPQLGLKTAIGFFHSISFLMALVGVFLFLWSLFTKGGSDGRGDLMRQAFGVLVPSGLVFGAHFVALQRTNAAELPLVPRMFAGVTLIITGFLGFGSLLGLFMSLFARGESGEMGRMWVAAVLSFPVAWVVLGLQFVKRVTGGLPPPGGQVYARPVPPPAVPPPS